MKYLRNIVTVVILLGTIAVGVLFALQNKEPVALDMLVYHFAPQSLALWILSAFALGGLAGMLISSAIMIRSRASLGSSRRQLAKARAELDQVRSAESKPVATSEPSP